MGEIGHLVCEKCDDVLERYSQPMLKPMPLQLHCIWYILVIKVKASLSMPVDAALIPLIAV